MFPYLGHFNLDWDRIDKYCNSGLWFDLGYPRIKNEDDHWRHQKNKQWYNDNNSSVKELWATEQDFFPDSWFYTLGLQKDRYTAKIFWTKPGNFEPPHVDFFPSFIGKYNQKGDRWSDEEIAIEGKKILRAWIPLHDSKLGHILYGEDYALAKWKLGDVFELPSGVRHGFANGGTKDRFLLVFTGYRNGEN